MISAGERIKNLRKEKRFTQDQLAEMLGVSKVAVQKYENGRITMKTKTLEKLGVIFGVSELGITLNWELSRAMSLS